MLQNAVAHLDTTSVHYTGVDSMKILIQKQSSFD